MSNKKPRAKRGFLLDMTILLCALSGEIGFYSISRAVAIPMPPPPQIMASPRVFFLFFMA